MGRTVVALDIGSENLRAIEFTRGRRAPTVKKIATSRLAHGVVEAGEVRDPDALSAALKALWSDGKLASKRVVFGVANNSVMVRQLELDWLVPAEFAKALKFQVADHIPMPVEDTNLGYHVLSEYDAPNPEGPGTKRMVRILLVVATSDMVSSFVAPIRAAGLLPIKLELAPFALIRAAEPAATAAGPAQPGSGVGVAEAAVDIGADVTTVVVHRQGQPRYVRILTGHGGNAVTDALAGRHGWSRDVAERAKRDSAPVSVPPGPGSPAPGDDVIARESGLTIGEIRNSLDYFMSTSPDVTSLSRVVLTGGGSKLPGLEARLGSELRMPVHAGDPWQSMGAQKKRAARPDSEGGSVAELAVALGLALGAA